MSVTPSIQINKEWRPAKQTNATAKDYSDENRIMNNYSNSALQASKFSTTPYSCVTLLLLIEFLRKVIKYCLQASISNYYLFYLLYRCSQLRVEGIPITQSI